MSSYTGLVIMSIVLIETSWNVKAIVAVTDEPLPGINRNIVECKEIFL